MKVRALRRSTHHVVVLTLTVASSGCRADEAPPSANAAGEQVAPQRIVSLIPAVTEILVALGATDRLVARIDSDDAPKFGRLPSVGRMLTPNLEALASVEPDLVIAWSGSDVSAVRRVVERGLGRVRTTSVDRLADIGPVIAQVGAWIGEEESADRLKAEVGETLDLARHTALGAVRQGAGDRTPTVFTVDLAGRSPGSYLKLRLAPRRRDIPTGRACSRHQ